MAKFVTEGLNRIVDILFGAQSVDATLYLGLYMNATEPALSAGLSGLTEPAGSGYARLPLTRGSWILVGALATYASQVFNNSGTNWGDIRGIFICTTVTGTSGKLLSVDHLAQAIAVADGESMTVLPKMQLS
jgi:hypothetical protein